MFAAQNRDSIQKLQNAVRSYELGPPGPDTIACAAEASVDRRHSEIKRIRDASRHHGGRAVESVGGRVDVVIVAEEGLIVVSVTKAGFIHHVGIGCPSPGPRSGLR